MRAAEVETNHKYWHKYYGQIDIRTEYIAVNGRKNWTAISLMDHKVIRIKSASLIQPLSEGGKQ